MMEPIVAGFQSCWADEFSDFLGAEIFVLVGVPKR